MCSVLIGNARLINRKDSSSKITLHRVLLTCTVTWKGSLTGRRELCLHGSFIHSMACLQSLLDMPVMASFIFIHVYAIGKIVAHCYRKVDPAESRPPPQHMSGMTLPPCKMKGLCAVDLFSNWTGTTYQAFGV